MQPDDGTHSPSDAPSLHLSDSVSSLCLPKLSTGGVLVGPPGPCNSRPDRHSSGERQPHDVHISKPSAASARQSGMRCRNPARCIAHLTSPCLFRPPLACSLQPPVIILRRRCVQLAQDRRHSRSKVLCTCRCVCATAGPPTRQTTCAHSHAPLTLDGYSRTGAHISISRDIHPGVFLGLT